VVCAAAKVEPAAPRRRPAADRGPAGQGATEGEDVGEAPGEASGTGAGDRTARGDAGPVVGADDAPDADGVAHVNPVFEPTPLEHVDAVVTETGVLDGEDVAATARRHRLLAGWPASAD
ncbi:MAG: hypothetical protein ABEJ42_02880, partial [Halobacteriaceae archaeon]